MIYEVTRRSRVRGVYSRSWGILQVGWSRYRNVLPEFCVPCQPTHVLRSDLSRFVLKLNCITKSEHAARNKALPEAIVATCRSFASATT